MFSPAPPIRRSLPALAAIALLLVAGPARAQLQPAHARAVTGGSRDAQRPQAVDADTARLLPYRLSGRLLVSQGRTRYQGTATVVRRYTGLTAAHLLYDAAQGFSTNAVFQQALDGRPTQPDRRLAASAIVAGYQGAADTNSVSREAFNLDMGILLFVSPAPGNEWATWDARPADLAADPARRLVFGYAAENFVGTSLAAVEPNRTYGQILETYYDNTAYYTEGGMSGGPVYVRTAADPADGAGRLLAVVVSGTTPPTAAHSGVRAIGPADRTMLVDAEYIHGFIADAKLKGPTTVAAGGTAVYKTGVIFADGTLEKLRYGELQIVPAGPGAASVTVEKFRNDRFAITFGADLPAGTPVELRLVRDTATDAPLRTLTVTVQ